MRFKTFPPDGAEIFFSNNFTIDVADFVLAKQNYARLPSMKASTVPDKNHGAKTKPKHPQHPIIIGITSPFALSKRIFSIPLGGYETAKFAARSVQIGGSFPGMPAGSAVAFPAGKSCFRCYRLFARRGFNCFGKNQIFALKFLSSQPQPRSAKYYKTGRDTSIRLQ